MTAPLPPAASRVGDPDNFVAEADLFLSRLAPFRTEANALATYVNAAPLNIWNWGLITDINPLPAYLTQIAARPFAPGVAWANAQDSLWASLEAMSYTIDGVGEFVDDVGALTGATIDPERPLASMLSVAPARGQPQATFNTNSGAFYDSADIYTTNLNTLSGYFYLAISPDDFGLTTTPSTITIDWGTL